MIKISVVSYNNEISSDPLSAVFGPAGASIGRSNDNFLVLQDPKRYVSRLQASVKSDGVRHSIINLSQANPILVNGEEIALGKDVSLRYGDEIQIGLYLLKAEPADSHPSSPGIDAKDGAFVAPFSREPMLASAGASSLAANSASSHTPVDVMALDLSALGNSGDNPFADLLGDVVSTPTAITHANQQVDRLVHDVPNTLRLDAASSFVPYESTTRTNIDPLGFDDLLGSPSPSPTNGTLMSPARAPTVHDNPFGFDDLLGDTSHTQLSPERNAAIIPDDFDPFAMPSAAQRNSHDPLAGLSSGEVSLESIARPNVTIDGLMSSAGTHDGASLLDPAALGVSHSSDTDPLALFSSEPILNGKKNDKFLGDVASNHVSELNSHFAMPQARQESAPKMQETPPEAIVQSAPSVAHTDPLQLFAGSMPTIQEPATAVVESTKPAEKPSLAAATTEQQAQPNQKLLDGHALAEAFLRGANLPLDTIPSGVTLEWMEMMGRFVATATDGAVELIASRALVKREVKADLTMIVVRNNNPLKFLPDGQSALIQMLGRKIPGFMNPVEAMQDAYVDLRAHQIGVVAGMRAALDEVLRRFDPVMLEKKLKTRTLIDSLVAANRKAKMWDLYAELFKDIYIEAQDDFQTLFGKAFLMAYENEIESFRQRSKT
jgi:FHA domain-containing protein